MSKWASICIASMLSGLPAVQVQAQAQELTDEQLAQVFREQEAAIDAARDAVLGPPRSLARVGDTRGIKIEPLESAALEEDNAEGSGTETPGMLDDVVDTAQLTASSGVAVIPPRSGLLIDVQIEFPFDSAALTEDQIPKLQQLCRVMGRDEFGGFRIIGHTDAKGDETYNDRLSLLRAEEVVRYFVSSCGLDGGMLEAIGLGERQLLDAADPDGAANRRVEFQVHALS